MSRVSKELDVLLEKPEFSILNTNIVAINDERCAIQELEKLADVARHAIVNKPVKEDNS